MKVWRRGAVLRAVFLPVSFNVLFGFMGHLRQTGRKTTIRSTETYFAPLVPGKYYVSFEGWQMEGCNGIGFLKKRAVAEVEVTP